MRRAVLLVPLLFALAAYLPALAGDFCWDDAVLVAENRATAPPVDWRALLTADLWETTPVFDGRSGYWRPLLLLDLALDRALFGLAPAPHRLHSLLWHLAGVLVALGLYRRLGLSPPAAAAGAALVAVHPAQVESAVFVSARNDPMALALGGAALLLLLRDRPGPRHAVLAAVAALGALLSKESAVAVLPAYALLERARTGSWGSRVGWAALVGAAGGYAALRAAAGVGLPPGTSPVELLHALPDAAGWQLVALARPLEALPGRHVAWSPPPPLAVVVAVLAALALLGLAGGRRARAGLALAAVAWPPALAAIARLGLVSGRYLALPLLGFGLALGAALDARVRADRLRGLVAAALAAGLALASAPVLRAWRDDVTLWTAALRVHRNPYAEATLASALEKLGRLDEAAALYEAATAPPLPFGGACARVASVHLARGDAAAAARAGLAALDAGCAPIPELLGPTALALALEGRFDEAEELAAGATDDPTGRALLARLAAAAIRGDLGPLAAAEAEHPERAAKIRADVAAVLERAGAGEAAEAVRASGGGE